MTYKNLYSHCQSLSTKISTKDIKNKTLELTGIPKVRVLASDLDTSICRGLYLSAANTEHPLVKQNGGHIIVLARDIMKNKCWSRFVLVKELMHLFDSEIEATDNGDEFDRLLTELSVDAISRSDQMQSEINSFWMALAVLCPEQERQELEEKRKNGLIDDYGIALKLRIPQKYVPSLFRSDFKNIIGKITEEMPAKLSAVV